MTSNGAESKSAILFKESFYCLTAVLLVFAMLEIVWPGVVLAYININWVLISWLIIGIVVLSFDPKNNSRKTG